MKIANSLIESFIPPWGPKIAPFVPIIYLVKSLAAGFTPE